MTSSKATGPEAPPGDPPDDEADSGPHGAWFQSTQPPADARGDGPEASRDPTTYVLGAIALGVIVVLGGAVLLG